MNNPDDFLICVGGPRDGQTFSRPGDVMQVLERDPVVAMYDLARMNNCEASPADIKTCMYMKTVMRAEDKTFWFWRYAGMSVSDALRHLLSSHPEPDPLMHY